MRAGRADPWRGVEIVGLDEGSGRRLACRIEAFDAVDRRVAGFPACVVLANRDQSLMPLIEDEVGVPDVLGRRDRDGWPSRIVPVEALILEVGEPDGALAHQVPAAAILVDPRARVVLRRRDVRDAPVGTAPDNDITASLGRPLLDPIDVIAVELDLR